MPTFLRYDCSLHTSYTASDYQQLFRMAGYRDIVLGGC